MIRLLSFIFLCLLLICCNKDDQGSSESTLDYQTGKNRFTIDIEGVEREFYIHVPSNLPTDPMPLVFMLHGSSGNGEKFYNISGWKEVGEREGILTVFPSSGGYCIIDEGVRKNTTKWNTFRSWEFCTGETPLDDFTFFREILEALQATFNIDDDRMYLAGFSNGGRMAANCAVEMSDVFAAITENSGTFPVDTGFNPLHKLPMVYQIGNREDRMIWMGRGQAFPLSSFSTMLDTSLYLKGLIATHVRTLDLNPNYRIMGDTSTVMSAVFTPNDGSNREWRYNLVNMMEHVYPNGTNHPMEGAELQWEWFTNYSK